MSQATTSAREALLPTRWVHVQNNDAIGYQSLAISAFLIPILVSLPVFFLGGARPGWIALATQALAALMIAGGTLLRTARAGMVGYQDALESSPSGVSVTRWHRWLYEHPVTEYFVFRLGGGGLRAAWVLVNTLVLTMLLAPLVHPFIGALANPQPVVALVVGIVFLGYHRPVFQITAALAALAMAIAGVWFSVTDLELAAFLLFAPIILGYFEKMKGDRRIQTNDSEGRGEHDSPVLIGPPFTYFVATGLIPSRFEEGGMYRRAKRAVVLATVAEMAARSDAADFQAVSGQVHRGGRLAGADLAAALARLEG